MSNRAGLGEVALFPVGERWAGFSLRKAAKLRANDTDRLAAVLVHPTRYAQTRSFGESICKGD
jgi:hypothetical protein